MLCEYISTCKMLKFKKKQHKYRKREHILGIQDLTQNSFMSLSIVVGQWFLVQWYWSWSSFILAEKMELFSGS